jgi:hypothetical protein
MELSSGKGTIPYYRLAPLWGILFILLYTIYCTTMGDYDELKSSKIFILDLSTTTYFTIQLFSLMLV